MNVPTMNKQIIFVDSSVQDYQSLIENADGAQIVILNDNLSGIEQITNALANQQDIESVHIVSHGSEGSLKLGGNVLNENNLETFSSQIKQWRNALSEKADILLYACNLARGQMGQAFVQRLSQLTNANIAAATNLTGSAALGGDWKLSFRTGKIAAGLAFSPAAIAAYSHILPSNDNFANAVVVPGTSYIRHLRKFPNALYRYFLNL